MSLPPAFLGAPIAHRGLHGPGVPENSLASFQAAMAGGYGIECDLQLSADGVAMVFHDPTLDRMTAEAGAVWARPAATLAEIGLVDGQEGIPTLSQMLETVAGAAPILIELKDQSGRNHGSDGALEAATAAALQGYAGPVAVMSFNPDMVAEFGRLAEGIPRGLTTCDFAPGYWSHVPPDVAAAQREIAGFDRVGASFISHDARDLDAAPVAALKAKGVPVLCWTIRSAAAEAEARRVADNVTFEGYRPTKDL